MHFSVLGPAWLRCTLDARNMPTQSGITVERTPLLGPFAVVIPFIGFFLGRCISSRPHGHESGEASLIHFFQFAGVFALGFAIALVLALSAVLRRERYRWFLLPALILDYLITTFLLHSSH